MPFSIFTLQSASLFQASYCTQMISYATPAAAGAAAWILREAL